MIQIIEEKDEWKKNLMDFDPIDFCHTYDYHVLDANEHDKPILILYSESEKKIALPLLLRSIPDTHYIDATSVYGYSGPLSKNIDESFDNRLFFRALNALLLQLKVVSIFARLNPFIPHQKKCLEGIGEVKSTGKLVNINLTAPPSTQRKQYRSRLNTYVNKAKRECSVKRITTGKELNEFIDMYYETMIRKDAEPKYFFSKDYFGGLLRSEDFKSEIWLAFEKTSEAVIAGILSVKKGDIVQYHLSAAKEEYLHLNAVKLLIDTLRVDATEHGYLHLNLGGGVGSKEDSLFRFKSGFSKEFRNFETWNYICDEVVYEKLILEKLEKQIPSLQKRESAYFPKYRSVL